MSSPLFNLRPLAFANYKSHSQGMVIAILMLGLSLSGCNKSANDSDTVPKIEITADEITIDSSLIQTSIPERYQPSYNLEGALIPVNTVKITAPSSVHSVSLLVKPEQWVEQGQELLKVQTKLSEADATSLLDEFTDVFIQGEKISKDSLQTQLLEGELLKGGTVLGLGDREKDNERSINPSLSKDNLIDSLAEEPTKDNTTELNEKSKSNSMSGSNHNLLAVTIVYKAPISGKVTKIENPITEQPSQEVDAVDPLVITLANTKQLQLIGQLPLFTKSQLAVGRSVNFTVYDTKTNLSGQISDIIPDITANNLIVKAILLPDEQNKADLKPGMLAAMTIEYGQIELGVRLPKGAIHEAELDKLNDKHPRPTNPLKGFVWVIGQDHQLSYTPIEVVEYFEDSKQFLVSGINNDSLIIVAEIPKTASGKTVSVH